MKKILLLWVFISLICTSVSALSPAEIIDLPSGTLLKLAINDDITEEDYKKVSDFEFEVIEGVDVNGEIRVPAGTHVTLTIDKKNKTRVGAFKTLAIYFNKLKFNDQEFDIKTSQILATPAKGKKDGKKINVLFKAGTKVLAKTI